MASGNIVRNAQTATITPPPEESSLRHPVAVFTSPTTTSETGFSVGRSLDLLAHAHRTTQCFSVLPPGRRESTPAFSPGPARMHEEMPESKVCDRFGGNLKESSSMEERGREWEEV